MTFPLLRCLLALVPSCLVACASLDATPHRPAQAIEAVGKVVDSLAGETTRRLASDAYRALPVTIGVANAQNNAVELIVAEFLRTRLHERGAVVQVACAGRCMEVTLQEFATSNPAISQFTPGQILTVATGSVPVLGGLTRSIGEREREAERAAARTTGLLVTFAARDGNRYSARSHVVAIVSTGSGDVALEQK